MKKPLSLYALSFLFIGLFCGAIALNNEMLMRQKNSEIAPQKEQVASVVVDMPQAQSTISSPFITNGKARGTWFFEGSFPIEVIDSNGTSLGTGIAHAQGDWMTEAYVPFDATITFITATSTTHGFVLYKKDNPSGMPEHDAVIAVPVIFAQ